MLCIDFIKNGLFMILILKERNFIFVVRKLNMIIREDFEDEFSDFQRKTDFRTDISYCKNDDFYISP